MILNRLEFMKLSTEKLSKLEKTQRQSRIVQRSHIKDVEFPEEEKKEKEQMQTSLESQKHSSATTEELEAMIPPSKVEVEHEPELRPRVQRGLAMSPSKESIDEKSEVFRYPRYNLIFR